MNATEAEPAPTPSGVPARILPAAPLAAPQVPDPLGPPTAIVPGPSRWPVAKRPDDRMRIVVVSNRLPLIIEREEGALSARPGAGGLVTALAPILRTRGGLWIGWAGPVEPTEPGIADILRPYAAQAGYELISVFLTPEEQEGFYQGFSNQIVWPLFHDLQTRCNFVPDYWNSYIDVQRRFADVVQVHARPADLIWVQDYHLMLLGKELRDRGVSSRLGFFLHIPFPPPDIFSKLPWRERTLEALLHYDTIGFQTPRDRANFTDCVRRWLPQTRIRRRGQLQEMACGTRLSQVGVFPAGIDFSEFAGLAKSPSVNERVRRLRREMPDVQIILSVDRLDYTKGIPDRLKALRLALRTYPELHRRILLFQLVVPSRADVPEYQEMKGEIEQLVAQVNGEFTQPGWVPIHYVYNSVEREELVALYRLADAALITPLKDGMNLVAKEYVACQTNGDGVLILSEFAGSAVQLGRDALLVNPYDHQAVADAIHRAATMPLEQRRPAMRRLRACVRRQDVFWWLKRFLTACGLDARQHAIPED